MTSITYAMPINNTWSVQGTTQRIPVSSTTFKISNEYSIPWHFSDNYGPDGLKYKIYDANLYQEVYRGSFSYSASGQNQQVYGTINQIEIYFNQQLGLTISGFSIDANKFESQLRTGQNALSLIPTDYLAANGSNGSDVLSFNGNKVDYRGGGGNDTINGSSTAINTAVFSGSFSQYSISKGNVITTVTDSVVNRDGSDALQNIQRLKFVDGNIAYDINGNAGEAYRIYQAAFDRKPDASGLGYWISQLDKGASLHNIADGFIGSTEFKNLFGSSPTNAAFVDALYKNVLHRVGELDGVNYWNGVLNSGGSRADVLASFSESPENKAGVIGSIQDGIHYTEWTG